MLIFYIDECGDHSLLLDRSDPTDTTLKPGVSPYFVLAAVGIRDSSRKPLAEAIFRSRDGISVRLLRHLGARPKSRAAS